jgi:hypothetical protein
LTTPWPVTVPAEMAVKNVSSRGVNTRSLLEMGKLNSRPPMIIRTEKPKNRMKGDVNRRRGRVLWTFRPPWPELLQPVGKLRYPEDSVVGLRPQTGPIFNDGIKISYWDSSYSPLE